LVAHPFIGGHKLEILKNLLTSKPKLNLTLVVDMIEQAEAISEVAQATMKTVPVYIKLDTGVARYGVLPGEPALAFANKLKQFLIFRIGRALRSRVRIKYSPRGWLRVR